MSTALKKPGPNIAAALWGEAVQLLERVCESTFGEVTPDVEAAERYEQMTRRDAADAHARLIRYMEATQAAVERERERLAAVEARCAKVRAWSCGELLRILGDDKKLTTDTFEISTRAGSKYVVADSGLDLSSLPPYLVRYTEPKPAMPCLDKVAAKEYLADPENPPIPGLHLGQNPRTVKVE